MTCVKCTFRSFSWCPKISLSELQTLTYRSLTTSDNTALGLFKLFRWVYRQHMTTNYTDKTGSSDVYITYSLHPEKKRIQQHSSELADPETWWRQRKRSIDEQYSLQGQISNVSLVPYNRLRWIQLNRSDTFVSFFYSLTPDNQLVHSCE